MTGDCISDGGGAAPPGHPGGDVADSGVKEGPMLGPPMPPPMCMPGLVGCRIPGGGWREAPLGGMGCACEWAAIDAGSDVRDMSTMVSPRPSRKVIPECPAVVCEWTDIRFTKIVTKSWLFRSKCLLRLQATKLEKGNGSPATKKIKGGRIQRLTCKKHSTGILKFLEKIIAMQLTEYKEAKVVLPDIQSGFRRGYGCSDALLKITDDIIVAKDASYSDNSENYLNYSSLKYNGLVDCRPS
ncbi:unnamed protein product [Acanthoscelides obtectus]|uniref:Reverse transcriptase domain-containing protein n=1 Tax=Acanthoscelides obtectus TaxID=200917 RepID=A0A9P0JRN5_ACAOB|nr:unnamed protein product [Acanthoscelides obtectus]CAK1654411.1 hypothetical protein AOBTE_LOCUS18567 [Acanthoscelides obtectus]